MSSPFAMPVNALVLGAVLASGCASRKDHSPTPTASVTIANARGIPRPTFTKIDGADYRRKRKVHLAPGKHEARIKLSWPEQAAEIVNFPLALPEGGAYYIEVLPFRSGVPLKFRPRTFNPDDVDGYYTGVFLFLPAAARPLSTLLPDRGSPIESITLRLRSHSLRGPVLFTKRYLRPTSQTAGPIRRCD